MQDNTLHYLKYYDFYYTKFVKKIQNRIHVLVIYVFGLTLK